MQWLMLSAIIYWSIDRDEAQDFRWMARCENR